MKRILLIMACAAPSFMFAQTVLISDNFDSYTAGNALSTESAGVWETWSGTAPEDPLVSSTQSSSPSNSIQVMNTGAGAYLHDIVLPLPSVYTTGVYEYKMKVYVPSGSAAYFNLGSVWATGGAGYEYGIDVFFNADATGHVATANTGVFNYNLDAWNDVSVMVNLNSGLADVTINGTLAHQHVWAAASGFGVVDIFGFGYADATAATEVASDFYVDDVELVDWTAASASLEATVSNPVLNVVPNPSNGNFVMNFEDMSMKNANVALTDILGKTIYSENMSVVGNGSLPFNMNLRNGVYFVTVTDGNMKLTKKIIVKK